ncbi:MAG: glutamate racemase [Treponema sp.]|jgi:glutamate racemase|nr:glutamate racemase [Treponema sp.]
MDNRPVLFIDSGIGGLLYCADFIEKNPQEEVCYLADRENFPYGQRGKEELSNILIALTEKLIKTIDPKIIVLACNTATVSALEQLRRKFPQIPFVGTVPAIKPAANASVSGKVGVLGTARTIEDPYNQSLAEGCEKKCEIIGIAASELVEFIEQHFEKADKNEKKKIVKKYIDIFREKGVDTLVLGCTHFLYLLEEFKQEAAPSIKVFDSLDGITKRIEFLLDENSGALRTDIDFEPVHWLLLTGMETADSSWHERAQKLDFALCLLDKLENGKL